MFKLGREIHTLAALNWRDVFDNLHRFAQGVNEINRDSLKAATVTNDLLSPKTLYKIFGFLDYGFKQPIPEANQFPNHWMDQLNTSRVLRRVLSLEDDEFGSYMLSWRINFETEDDYYVTATSYQQSFYAEVSVDGIRIGGPMGADDFVPHGFVDPGEGERPPINEFLLSGFCIMNLLGGSHVVAIDLFSIENVTIENIDASITRMNW